jgi:hypothetical protein
LLFVDGPWNLLILPAYYVVTIGKMRSGIQSRNVRVFIRGDFRGARTRERLAEHDPESEY